jgi:dipeptidase E
MKNLLLASTSTLYGGGYLEYLSTALETIFSEAEEIVFIPFARPGGITQESYTQKVQEAFHPLGKRVRGLHSFSEPAKALERAQAIFTGGGNTFLLVQQLHLLKLMEPLREILHKGTPYLGASAGTNICGITMQTTNDMPIVHPPSFKTLGMVPFNINPHYLDPPPNNRHMGETRETRIKEFHTQSTVPVVGLREGSWIRVQGEDITLCGPWHARIFIAERVPSEIPPGSSLALL